MSDTPENKARLASIFEAIRRLSEEAGLYDDEVTPDEVVAAVKQVRKEMTEERAKEEPRGLNPSYMAFDEDKGEKE